MKKILKFMLIAGLVPSLALADCDWKKGITPTYGGYLYTKECHILVGQTVHDLSVSKGVVSDLGKVIDLKNEEITLADQRIDLWKNTSAKLEDRLNEVQRLEKRNAWLYAGIGVLVTGIAVIGVHQIGRK